MEAITVAATSCSSPSLLSQSSCFHRHPSSVQAFNSRTTTSSSSSSLYSRCRIRPPRIVYGNHIHNPLFSSNLMSTSFLKMPNNPRFKVSAVFDRFTERAIKVVIFSQREARAMGSNMVFTSHLLLGLVAEDSSPDGFLSSGITIDKVRDAVKKVDTHASKINIDAPATDIPFSISSKRVFEASVEYSRTMGSSFIAPEHIAIALLTVGTIGNLIKSLGADANHLASLALLKIKGDLAKDGREPLATDSPATSKKMWDSLSAKKPLFTVSPKKQNDKSKLAQFCVDLTARAVEGFIDPVIGRDTEIQRIVQILCRRTKNNCVLLGEPGVGKTAMAEGLAIRIAEKETPNFLWEKRILSLDVGLLMAGAKERGELESRVTGLLTEVKKSGDVILFIDEVHTLIGSGIVGKGNKSSGLDIANLLKPSLGRGELQCIASTTIDEHRTHFEKDKALARRFQPIFIDEPSQEDTIQILIGLRDKYEAHHKCRFTLEAINAAVYLSERYIPDRYLPDKAIDLIDEAGSRACMNAYKKNKEQQTCILSMSPDEYWQEIRAVRTMHDMVIENKIKKHLTNKGDGELSSEMEIKIDGSFLKSSSQNIEPIMVGPEDIAAVASLWSGIPVQKLTADERMILIGLDEKLKGRVVGQDDAVSAISRAVKRSRVGLKDPDRPISTMLFCGPTGVGKTELTKALAACYFGSETAMLRLDMSEYMERHSVSKLIGSPPGYIGYGEGGTLTEAIRRRPFTVLLLDEIEKAHSDIFNILLQVFEDGHLTDSQGRRVSFKNTLIVMTSNVGSDAISNGKRSIGFMLSNDSESNTSYTGMKETLMEELKTFFRPELLNRVDEIVVFRPLEKTQMLEILNIMLKEVKGRIEDKGINLKLTEAILNLVCEKGYDRSYGARPLRRAVTQIIEDILGESMLSEEYKKGDTALLDVDTCGNPFVTHLDEYSNQLASS